MKSHWRRKYLPSDVSSQYLSAFNNSSMNEQSGSETIKAGLSWDLPAKMKWLCVIRLESTIDLYPIFPTYPGNDTRFGRYQFTAADSIFKLKIHFRVTDSFVLIPCIYCIHSGSVCDFPIPFAMFSSTFFSPLCWLDFRRAKLTLTPCYCRMCSCVKKVIPLIYWISSCCWASFFPPRKQKEEW